MPSRDHVTFADAKSHQPERSPTLAYRPNFSKRTVDNYLRNGSQPTSQRSSPSTSSRPALQRSSTTGSLLNIQGARKRQVSPTQTTERHLKHEESFSLPTFQWIKGNLIGRGSQGKVYIALNATTGECMAVKQVERPQTASDRMKVNLKDIVDALREERETLKGLDHPNIVQYLGFEENHETLNIFLEYVSGGTITTCLKTHGKFQENVTKYFTRQILQGLSYLHSRDILHRDLKADNILVEESGICKISDFGISKQLDERARAFSIKGTSFWMAPEALSHYGRGYDIKIDVWSVGCIVHEMWTALQPWSNEGFLSAMGKLMDSEDKLPPLPDDLILSNLANHFRRECFQTNPDDRPGASLLLDHPYLALPLNWEFPGMTAMGCAPNADIVMQTFRRPEDDKALDYGSGVSDITKLIPDALSPRSASSAEGPMSPAFTMNSQISRSSVRPLPLIPPLVKLPRPISPPLVTVVPFGPRKPNTLRSSPSAPRGRRSSTTSESSASQASSTDSTSRKARKLVLHRKVDSLEEKQEHLQESSKSQPYIYTPPPLPNVSQHSTHLLPHTKFIEPVARYPEQYLQKIGLNTASGNLRSRRPPIVAGSSFSTIKPTPSGSSNTRPAGPTTNYQNTSPTDTDSTGYSMWQKRPGDAHYMSKVALQQSQSTNNATSSAALASSSVSYFDSDSLGGGSTWEKPPVARQDSQSAIASNLDYPLTTRQSISPSTRPAIMEVFKKLEDFFPEHNLDMQVIENTDMDPDTRVTTKQALDTTRERAQAKRVTMKSIKSIAEEHLQRGQLDSPQLRRQTRLWDSRLEEIKAPR